MESIESKNEIVQKIEALCKQRGWSHYRLSKQSQVPYSSISNMFIRNTYPSIPVLFRLCEGFQISVSDFFLDINKEAFDLLPAEIQLIASFRSLEASDKELALAYIKGLRGEL